MFINLKETVPPIFKKKNKKLFTKLFRSFSVFTEGPLPDVCPVIPKVKVLLGDVVNTPCDLYVYACVCRLCVYECVCTHASTFQAPSNPKGKTSTSAYFYAHKKLHATLLWRLVMAGLLSTQTLKWFTASPLSSLILYIYVTAPAMRLQSGCTQQKVSFCTNQ